MSLESSKEINVIFFLAAAKGDQREFAVTLSNDRPLNPVQPFDPARDRSGFHPRETLFALSEAIPTGDGFRTRLLHVETDGNARPTPVDAPAVLFRLSVKKQGETCTLRYRMADESREMLQKRGFHPDYPFEFKRQVKNVDRDMLAGKTVDPMFAARLFSTIPLPPHHQSALAETARRKFVAGKTPPPVNLGNDDWEEPVRLAPQSGIVLVNALPDGIPPPPGVKH